MNDNLIKLISKTITVWNILDTIVSNFDRASVVLAREFILKVYEIEQEELDEIYFIGNDPTWVLGYGDQFWWLSEMYETLLHDYDPSDVWQWYYYTSENLSDDRSEYLNLKSFIGMYKGYKGELSDIAKKVRAEREANRPYWDSEEWKLRTKNDMDELKDKFLKDIIT